MSEKNDDDRLLVDCVGAVIANSPQWKVMSEDFWCHVRICDQVSAMQGWKLHVSATPLSAPLVLRRCARVLVRHGCSFKFAGNLTRVAQLVSRQVPRGSGGKFITAYPDGDLTALRALTEELHQATLGLPGPGILSDRPYRPGSLVYYRFGVFGGVPMLGNDGLREVMLVAPDGSLSLDSRNAWFSTPQWAPADPFDTGPKPTANGSAPKPVLLDDRYLVTAVVRHSFSGGVFRGTDRETGAAVIIKQARPHTGGNLMGHDTRDLRRHEHRMLERFAPLGRTPRPVGMFEQQGELFGVQEAVSGTTLRAWVSKHAALDKGTGWGPPLSAVVSLATALVDLVGMVHDEGLVLRDLNPNNVMVTQDGQLRLIDLEMLVEPGTLVNAGFTPGYEAPEQAVGTDIGPAPDPAADRYSLGATLFYLATGMDPLLASEEPEPRPHHLRISEWLTRMGTGNAAANRLAPIILDLMATEPAERPGLGEVRDLLSAPRPAATPARPAPWDFDRFIDDATNHLIATMDSEAGRLWPTSDSGQQTDPYNVQHGAAGVLGVLTHRLRVDGLRDPALRQGVAEIARWIVARLDTEPRLLPGLHFGRNGTAWALLDAATVLDDSDMAATATSLARRIPWRSSNPDVCHGMSGAGFTQLRFAEGGRYPEFTERAVRIAETLTETVVRDGDGVAWPIPREFNSKLAGLTHFGFAHGHAGIGCFLLAAGIATGDDRFTGLALEAATTLAGVAELDDGAAYWPGGPQPGPRKTHWCSGSSGVGTFLARIWRHTGDTRFEDLATAAALAVHRTRWYAGTAQCHGLAGDAEFLLDLADLSGQSRFHDWAADLAHCVYLRQTTISGRVLAPDETGSIVSADYNTGLAGVLAMLLRLRHGGPRLWLPESFTPTHSGDSRPSTATGQGSAALVGTIDSSQVNKEGVLTWNST